MDLKFNLIKACYDSNDCRLSHVVLDELGITYADSRPVPGEYSWMFFGCKNIPDKLPAYLEKMGDT